MTPPKYFRKVIRVQATDSPNVKLALLQQQLGQPVTGEELFPGLLTWTQYQHRLATWDIVRQTKGLRGEYYEGSQLLLYPSEWLDKAEERARNISTKNRIAKAMGCDPAEGGDKSAWSVIDELGLIEQVSQKTPNTNDVVRITLDLLGKYKIPPERVCFDRGGGGFTHVQRLNEMGYGVRSVGFGEVLALDPKRGLTTIDVRKENKAERYEYKNRRAQMYGELSEAMDPGITDSIRFAFPEEYSECRRQLAPMPKLYDDEGRMFMLPKNKKPTMNGKVSMLPTLTELLGCSPDEADSLVLAYHALKYDDMRMEAGVS